MDPLQIPTYLFTLALFIYTSSSAIKLKLRPMKTATYNNKKLTQSSCHVVGRTVTGMPDQLSFLTASGKYNKQNRLEHRNPKLNYSQSQTSAIIQRVSEEKTNKTSSITPLLNFGQFRFEEDVLSGVLSSADCTVK